MAMKIIFAGDNLSDITKEETPIYLAGPIPGKGIKSYRWNAIEILCELGFEGTVLIPEKECGGALNSDIGQANWEDEAMKRAKVIGFWVPIQATNMICLQFGKQLSSEIIVYGRPTTARGVRSMDLEYTKATGEQPFNNLKKMLTDIVDFLK